VLPPDKFPCKPSLYPLSYRPAQTWGARGPPSYLCGFDSSIDS
jgi:hypothetical protein